MYHIYLYNAQIIGAHLFKYVLFGKVNVDKLYLYPICFSAVDLPVITSHLTSPHPRILLRLFKIRRSDRMHCSLPCCSHVGSPRGVQPVAHGPPVTQDGYACGPTQNRKFTYNIMTLFCDYRL